MHYFISDTHFCESRPEHIACFLNWCATTPQAGDTLLLLGDIFEVWVGDDVETPVSKEIEAAIKALGVRRIKVYLMAGNRDFLIGKHFAARTGVNLLDDPSPWTLPNGEKCLLTHGDIFCTHDKGYRKFRAITRNRFIQWCFKKLPLKRRLKIADNLRMQSKNSQMNKAENLLDVSADLVEKMYRHHPDINLIVMGHTHRPNIHQYGNGQSRVVLGDWGEHMWVGVASETSRFELYRQNVKESNIELVYQI